MGKRPDAAARLQDNQLWRLRRNQQHLEAKDAGQRYYFTGKPCRKGHIAQRLVANKGCILCARERDRERMPQRLLGSAKQRAKKYNLPFTITLSDVLIAWPANNHCPIFPEIEFRARTLFAGPLERSCSPSLDKIRPELGYVPGNIAVISYRANTLKRNCADPAVFHRIADYIDQHTPPTTNV